MARILIIEDETAIADTLLYALGTEGYAAEHCTLGEAGLARLRQAAFDLVLLDVGLPDANGFDLCRRLRGFCDVPVIFLTARADEIDRVVGLEIGADDYVTKPFSPREVVARVRVVLRRLSRAPREADAPGNASPFHVEADKARISYRGHLLDLTRYEFLILQHLLAHPERIYSRGQLMEALWAAPDHAMERTVDTHIKTLRAKLRAVCPEADPIRTHRGLGYSVSLAE